MSHVYRPSAAPPMQQLHGLAAAFEAARCARGSHGIIWDHGTDEEDLMFVVYEGPEIHPEQCVDDELDAAIDRHLARLADHG
ncbi:MAG TPA: hypothetical protein VGN72_24175 [Tepidisphaeraceae bacterium]|nr:hypothetical protein [Tepidisphaeraceae bacterium]